MKNCHNDHDSHLIRDWSEAHSGGGNRFFQVSTFIKIATANINRLYEVFFQKTHLLRPLLWMPLKKCLIIFKAPFAQLCDGQTDRPTYLKMASRARVA